MLTPIQITCTREKSETKMHSLIAKAIIAEFYLVAAIALIFIIEPSSAASVVIGKNIMENLQKEQVVPDVIDKLPSNSIDVIYPSGVRVEQGKELTPTQVKDLPAIFYEAQPDQLYTLAMVDPDAPSRAEPNFREVLHFMVANIPGNNLAKGETLAEYIGAGAPEGTGLHRYVFLLFKQSGPLKSDMKISQTSRQGRFKFSLRNFAKANHLGDPKAANFFQAKYDNYVPILHAQLSKG